MTKSTVNKIKICQAAIALINELGLENLTMRKLANKLHIKAPSLYNHVKNKDQLLDYIQSYLYSHMEPLKKTDNWKKHLFELASYTRQGLLINPNLVTLFATRPTLSANALDQAEQTLTILLDAGFKYSEVLCIFRNLNVFVLGYVLAEVGKPPGADSDYKEPSISHMNINNYPTLNKASNYKTNKDFDKGFKLGLNTILNGLEMQLIIKK